MLSIKLLGIFCSLVLFAATQQIQRIREGKEAQKSNIEPIRIASRVKGYNLQSTPNNYKMATTIFDSQAALGDYSNRCKSLKFFAFRQGNTYLTAHQNDLKLTYPSRSEPNDDQLFEGIQNIDGTWAFKPKNKNLYLRADNNGVTINYQSFIGPWERWWIERHQGSAHCHIQSAQFQHYYWVFKEGVLQQTQGATNIIVQFWPDLNWGWNW